MIKLPPDKLKESLDLSLKIMKDKNFNDIKIIDLRQSNQVIINGWWKNFETYLLIGVNNFIISIKEKENLETIHEKS